MSDTLRCGQVVLGGGYRCYLLVFKSVQQILTAMLLVAVLNDGPQRLRPRHLGPYRHKLTGRITPQIDKRITKNSPRVHVCISRQISLITDQTTISLTLCFCSSVRTSLRTLAHGMSSGHHTGLQLSFPQPGFPRPVEYFSISGMNARSWA